MSSKFLFLFLLATTHAKPSKITAQDVLAARDDCKPCSPQGATGTDAPGVGSELKSLYIHVLESVKDIHFRRRWTDAVIPRADAFCCKENLDCVNLINHNIPMCYDKFTTQYAFPDGSWGSLTTGEYSADEGTANLISGVYTKMGGETGDIYAADPEEKPNTTTLSIPPQWTGTGEGSAVPPTEIASVITDAPSPSTETITTSAVATTATATGTSQDAAVPSASSTGAAGRLDVNSNRFLEVSVLGALMYVFNGLL